MGIEAHAQLQLRALPGIGRIEAGADLSRVIADALARAEIALRDGDVLTLTSKIVSRAEGRFVDLGEVEVSAEARSLASEIDKDPRLVEMILRESERISRKAPGVLIVRHRLGIVSANACIDASNARPGHAPAGSGPWILLLPEAPDRSAQRVRAALEAISGASLGVLITDSLGRPFRRGTVGAAIGVAGLPPLSDYRRRLDLDGRELEHSVAASADQIAAAADLLAGQADEARPVIHLRGLSFARSGDGAGALQRDPEEDLYL
ncbi:MAG: coenzyme F420-0:L-glutamate ligase [Myxococcales bacterium]|nr:coenzyme F420-0:L-glutamate ligase [Myxococcales bacterium]